MLSNRKPNEEEQELQEQISGNNTSIFFPPDPPQMATLRTVRHKAAEQKASGQGNITSPSDENTLNKIQTSSTLFKRTVGNAPMNSTYTDRLRADPHYNEKGNKSVDELHLPVQLLSTITFRYRDQGRRKIEAMFVPKGMQLNSKKIETLVNETWSLSMPNMVIICDAGSAHPSTLATRALCQEDAFQEWASEALAQTKKHIGRTKKSVPSPRRGENDSIPKQKSGINRSQSG